MPRINWAGAAVLVVVAAVGIADLMGKPLGIGSFSGDPAPTLLRQPQQSSFCNIMPLLRGKSTYPGCSDFRSHLSCDDL